MGIYLHERSDATDFLLWTLRNVFKVTSITESLACVVVLFLLRKTEFLPMLSLLLFVRGLLIALMTEAVSTIETSISFYEITAQHPRRQPSSHITLFGILKGDLTLCGKIADMECNIFLLYIHSR